MAGKTFAEDIEECAEEPLESCVIGEHGWGWSDEGHKLPSEKMNVVLPWSEARILLSYTYDRGYGSPDCHAIAAYSSNKIIICSQYDGSTELSWFYRNPQPFTPDMPGG